MTDPIGAKQTRLAPNEKTNLQDAPSSLLMQGSKREIPSKKGPFTAGMKGPPFPGSGSTREIKMSSEKQYETCSLVLVTLGCVQACFRVSFIYLWIGRPGIPLGRRLRLFEGVPRLKLEASEMRSEAPLVILVPRGIFRVPYWIPSDAPVIRCSCPRALVFAFAGPTVNSVPSFRWVISVGASGLKWGADSRHYLFTTQR
ncbi:hypothetical protein CRG98_012639 [Punica granatum]|uniref:Uncharacterized protein n=1 Tax=Punica granatum TaxID=22663 RepID=A0A2I0KEP2_PUNGR|nr:hypothetical protein CRG98_012639 [Punica granatum]